MNDYFVGSFISADDITLLSPSSEALNGMPQTCKFYTHVYNILFSANKTKCMYFHTNLTVSEEPIYFMGKHIEFVTKCKLLRVSITSDILERDIQSTVFTFNRNHCIMY